MKFKKNNKWRDARPANGRRRRVVLGGVGYLSEKEQQELLVWSKKDAAKNASANPTAEQWEQRLKEGLEPVEPEGSHEPTADQVTMNGRFGCE